MMNKISLDDLFVADYGWRVCRFYFSYAEYRDPQRDQFGVLQALNDEEIQRSKGFENHPHHEMEIISYCVRGKLAHRDSLGNQSTIGRGDVQYMCAGSGINHAEMNPSPDEGMRFLNIWIRPNEKGLTPQFGSTHFAKEKRHNKLLQVVSGIEMNGALQINQDANIFVSEIDKGEQLVFKQKSERQSYLVCIEGSIGVNHIELKEHEAIEIVGEAQLVLEAIEESHLLMVEMALMQ